MTICQNNANRVIVEWLGKSRLITWEKLPFCVVNIARFFRFFEAFVIAKEQCRWSSHSWKCIQSQMTIDTSVEEEQDKSVEEEKKRLATIHYALLCNQSSACRTICFLRSFGRNRRLCRAAFLNSPPIVFLKTTLMLFVCDERGEILSGLCMPLQNANENRKQLLNTVGLLKFQQCTLRFPSTRNLHFLGNLWQTEAHQDTNR